MRPRISVIPNAQFDQKLPARFVGGIIFSLNCVRPGARARARVYVRQVTVNPGLQIRVVVVPVNRGIVEPLADTLSPARVIFHSEADQPARRIFVSASSARNALGRARRISPVFSLRNLRRGRHPWKFSARTFIELNVRSVCKNSLRAALVFNSPIRVSIGDKRCPRLSRSLRDVGRDENAISRYKYMHSCRATCR